MKFQWIPFTTILFSGVLSFALQTPIICRDSNPKALYPVIVEVLKEGTDLRMYVSNVNYSPGGTPYQSLNAVADVDLIRTSGDKVRIESDTWSLGVRSQLVMDSSSRLAKFSGRALNPAPQSGTNEGLMILKNYPLVCE